MEYSIVISIGCHHSGSKKQEGVIFFNVCKLPPKPQSTNPPEGSPGVRGLILGASKACPLTHRRARWHPAPNELVRHRFANPKRSRFWVGRLCVPMSRICSLFRCLAPEPRRACGAVAARLAFVCLAASHPRRMAKPALAKGHSKRCGLMAAQAETHHTHKGCRAAAERSEARSGALAPEAIS